MNRGRINIPRDVEEYLRKKRTANIALFIFLEAVLISALIFHGDDIFGKTKSAFGYVMFGALMVLPWYWCKLKLWMFDKTWSGEIIGKEEEDYISVDRSLGRRGGIITNKKQHFKIRLDSGKIIDYTVYDDRARHAYRNTTYNVGDRVIHVGGAKYLQAVAVGDSDTLICVICGSESRAETPICHVCGKSLKID